MDLKEIIEWCRKASEKSNCKSRKVGAIIFREYKDNIFSVASACNYSECGRCPRNLYSPGERLDLCRAIHAENHAILLAARNGTTINKCSIFITHSPCFNCAQLIVLSGIKKVYFLQEYSSNKESLDYLTRNGVKWEEIY